MVKGWSYREKDPVSNLESAASDNISLTDTGDTITINGLPDNSKILISDLDGRLIDSTVVSGEYILSLDKLVKGIYVIVVNGRTFKITVNR